MPKTGKVLFLEHQKTAWHQIWHQIRIPRPSFTLKPVKTGFLLHGNTKNRRCSIFGTSEIGATQCYTKSDRRFGILAPNLPYKVPLWPSVAIFKFFLIFVPRFIWELNFWGKWVIFFPPFLFSNIHYSVPCRRIWLIFFPSESVARGFQVEYHFNGIANKKYFPVFTGSEPEVQPKKSSDTEFSFFMPNIFIFACMGLNSTCEEFTVRVLFYTRASNTPYSQ